MLREDLYLKFIEENNSYTYEQWLEKYVGQLETKINQYEAILDEYGSI